jgi:hypothetical protein
VRNVFGALAEFERSIIHERTKAGLEAARARGRTGGRPRALADKDLAAARALLSDPAITVEGAARRLKVAPSTLYRHLPGGRGALMDGGTFRFSRGALSSDSSTAAARSASMSRRCEPTTSTPRAAAASTMAASERRYPGEQVRATPPREPNLRTRLRTAPESPRSTRSPSRACEWPCLRGCAGARSQARAISDGLRGVGAGLDHLAHARASGANRVHRLRMSTSSGRYTAARLVVPPSMLGFILIVAEM